MDRKIAACLIAVALVGLSVGPGQAAPIADGTVIGIDIGQAATVTPDWNNITNRTQTIAAGAVVDTGGTVVDGVSIEWTSGGGGFAGGWTGWAEVPAGSLSDVPDSATSDIAFGGGSGSTHTLVISGLSTARTYAVAVVSQSGAAVNGRTEITTVTGASVTNSSITRHNADAPINSASEGLYHSFIGVAPTAGGVLTIACSDEANNPVVNAVRIEAEGPIRLSQLNASDITTNSATLSVVLGGTNADVTVYWEAGAVADPAAHSGWDGTNGPSAESVGAIQRAASGLTSETLYSYAFFATNTALATSVWSPVETFTTRLPHDGQLSYTGTQFSVGSAWRTASLTKPFDPDEDNVIGTDGYYVIGNNQRTSRPRYVASWWLTSSVFPGSPGYAYIDDPAVVPPGTATNYSGTANPSGTDVLVFSFVLGGTVPEHVRLGMMMDGLDNAGYNPDLVQLKEIGGGRQRTAPISTAGGSYNDRNPDWLFFDVINFPVGSEIGVYSSGGLNTLQVFAFDRVPPPAGSVLTIR